jgi:hypothetical protein
LLTSCLLEPVRDRPRCAYYCPNTVDFTPQDDKKNSTCAPTTQGRGTSIILHGKRKYSHRVCKPKLTLADFINTHAPRIPLHRFDRQNALTVVASLIPVKPALDGSWPPAKAVLPTQPFRDDEKNALLLYTNYSGTSRPTRQYRPTVADTVTRDVSAVRLCEKR